MSDAVPTTGPDGVRFRSRLEARWAQFFTLLDWPWQYEPDLGLKKWIPDFAISSGGGLLIEVKPAVTLAELTPHYARIENSGAVAQVWLVGAALALDTPGVGEPMVGVHGFCGMGSTWLWHPVTFIKLKALVARPKPHNFKSAQQLWITAGNEQQWRKG